MSGAYTNLLYHLVFSTKNRRPLIGERMKKRLYDYMEGIVRGENAEPLQINGVADHVHMLVRLRPTVAVADAIRVYKATSSKWANKEFRGGPHFEWQEGYAAFTVSQSQVPRLLAYIQNQEEHHRKRNFRSELVQLLKRHGIEFEERYLD
jgi:REP element-mobilizing transposase RayT